MTSPSYTIEVKENGRVNLPAGLRQALQLTSGDRLLVRVSGEGRAELVTASTLIREARGLYRHLRGEGSGVDELIADRRAEAERE
jgi:AbrB family looped-hinge helix DNA binding protein